MSRRIPRLETERLIIRELTLNDLEAIHELLNAAFGSDLDLEARRRWLQWTVLGYELFAELQQPHYGERAVVEKASGEVVGAVGVVPYLDTFNRVAAFGRDPHDPATAEVGLFWAIAPARQGQGFAVEAARALVQFLFEHEMLGRIIATTIHGNLPSQGVMRKLGMSIQALDEPPSSDTLVIGVLERGAGSKG